MDVPRFYFSKVFDDFKPLFEAHATGRRSFPKGSVIFSSEEPLDFCRFIERGLSSYSIIHESGAMKTLFYHAEGSLFPSLSSMRSYRIGEYNQAVTDVEGLILSQSALEALTREHPALMHRILMSYIDMFNFLIFDSINQSYNNAYVRLCNFLYLYAEYMDEPVGGKLVINLTQEEIANIVAVSRVQVSYIIGKLKRLGIISTSRGRILIENKTELARYCSGETLSH